VKYWHCLHVWDPKLWIDITNTPEVGYVPAPSLHISCLPQARGYQHSATKNSAQLAFCAFFFAEFYSWWALHRQSRWRTFLWLRRFLHGSSRKSFLSLRIRAFHASAHEHCQSFRKLIQAYVFGFPRAFASQAFLLAEYNRACSFTGRAFVVIDFMIDAVMVNKLPQNKLFISFNSTIEPRYHFASSQHLS